MPASTALLPRSGAWLRVTHTPTMAEPYPPPAVLALGRSAGDHTGKQPADAAAALQLYARLLDAGSARAAAHALVTALAAECGAALACLGWRDARGRTQLVAHSAGTADLAEAERRIGAIDEALDAGVALAWPDAEAAAAPHAAAAAALHLETAQLQRALGAAVAVLPLGLAGRPLGAVILERPGGPAFTATERGHAQHLLTLAAPALDWMRRAEAPWWRRGAEQARLAAAALRQPQRRTSRGVLALAALALAALATVPLPDHVGGRARIEGAEQRVLAAPADGFVKRVHVRPGDRVAAGAPLIDLQDDDPLIERERWASQLAQHQNAYAAAMARTDRAGAATALARQAEAQSQLALVDGRIGRGRIVAPFDALVIEGDLAQAAGAPVRQGDKLLTLATLDRHRVVIEVDETAIASVRPGQTGRLVLSALGWQAEDVVVRRIAPLARAVDGRNVFEVEAELLRPGPGLRAGQLGKGEIEVGRRPLLAAWCSRVADRLRLAWWSWLGA